MELKGIVNTALFAVALAMAAASFALMILTNITGESYENRARKPNALALG